VIPVAHPWQYQQCQPDKVAVIIADTGETLTYGEMMERADRCASLLGELGCATGDTIAILAENNAAYAELCWAAKNSGLFYACVSTQLNLEDARYVVADCDARVLIASETMRSLATEVAAQLAGQVSLLTVGGDTRSADSYEAMRDRSPAAPGRDAVRGASMLYSSGTTGRPKGVRTPLLNVPPTTPPTRHAFLVSAFGFSEQTVFINPGPFYHAAPLRMMMSVHRAGGTVIGFRKFDAEAVLGAIERYRATHGFFVPTMFNRMLRLPADTRAQFDLSSMQCAIHGAAPCPVAVKEAMISWWGPVIYEIYGGTEGFGQTFISPHEWLQRKGSVGRPVAGCELRILDEQGQPLGPGQTGLIYMSNGRRFEYYKDAQKTAEAHVESGLATMGDIGYIDENGYLFLTDRRAHMIISGGVNIYPQEAENVLATHPAVADVAVFGVPHADFGEEVKAVVVTHEVAPDPQALADELLAFCKARLSSYKCPRSIDFASELPRNDAGKLLKRLLKNRYWTNASGNIPDHGGTKNNEAQ
jgi:acyl-CoA synthetase (AMP-forming)/AMP-acid ligase II